MEPKPQPVIQVEEKPKQIPLTDSEFLQMVVDFESGKIQGDDLLIFFAYINENELFERYAYPYLLELLEEDVVIEGLINPYNLKKHKNSKAI